MALPQREIKVEENLHYVSWDGVETEKPVLANKGLTNWEQALNPSTDDGVQYIGEAGSQSQVTGYAPTVSYEGRAYPSDPFNYWLYQCGKEQIVGATFTEYEVETWNEVTASSGDYVAYQRTYEVQPDNPGSGEAGSKLTCSGTFAQQGDQVKGVYNIKTGTFTANSEASA